MARAENKLSDRKRLAIRLISLDELAASPKEHAEVIQYRPRIPGVNLQGDVARVIDACHYVVGKNRFCLLGEDAR